MRHIRNTAALWAFPLLVFGAGSADIPTVVQVIDEYGKTRVIPIETPSAGRAEGRRVVLPSCLQGIKEQSADRLARPSSGPAMLRIESEERRLRGLLREHTLAPYVPHALETALDEAVATSAFSSASSSAAVHCLEETNAAVGTGGQDQGSLLFDISSAVNGLRYGISMRDLRSTRPPTTDDEALYAADLLKDGREAVTSIAITQRGSVIRYSDSARLFGLFSIRYEGVVLDDGERLAFHSPWWLALSSYRPVAIREVPKFSEKGAVERLYLRAKAVLDALPGANAERGE